MNKKNIPVIIVTLFLVTIGIYGFFEYDKSEQKKVQGSDTLQKKPGNQNALQMPKAGVTNDSVTFIVNKQRPFLDKSYTPTDLVTPDIAVRVPGNESMQVRKILLDDLLAMFVAAEKSDAPLRISSGYRSYSYQVTLYNEWVKKSGQTDADRVSARPGYSEHQTGLAVDIEPLDKSCEIDPCFADTKAGVWIANHAHEYGFIVRYPKDKEMITGYTYEPWHLRYLGKDTANDFKKSGKTTLEEYYGLAAAPTY